MKAKVTLAVAWVLLLIGLALIGVGIMGFAGLYDIDLDRRGMAEVGLMYGLLGVLSAAGGWAGLRKLRRTEN
jgi:hypothetical protein